ncbi:unnamed protein product [Protopolystoma xenopodis]|uniref:Dynein heavy chain AAA 5 extension domain-containing protein n=1 Tax=Protopolystoma xenopodis TaxID=117903 RepID=A0A448X115_9PLAT|nr:unnamed protein product [Protopolystoma xenopodis]
MTNESRDQTGLVSIDQSLQHTHDDPASFDLFAQPNPSLSVVISRISTANGSQDSDAFGFCHPDVLEAVFIQALIWSVVSVFRLPEQVIIDEFIKALSGLVTVDEGPIEMSDIDMSVDQCARGTEKQKTVRPGK